MPEERTLSQKRGLLYIIGFVFNLSYAIPTYINSSFLAQYTTDALVGIVYTAGSIATIVSFIYMPTALKRFGNFKLTIGLLVLEALGLAGVLVFSEPLSIVCAFIIQFISIALINFTLDLFLESYSTNVSTGKIRGTFLTAVNIAWLLSPSIAAFLLMGDRYENIYLTCFLLLLPAIALIFIKLKGYQDPTYSRISFWKSLGEIWADRDIKGALMCQLLLQFFYAWMVIYMPIYLHETVGFDWSVIGVIFTIMLLPFVLIEAPLGRLADSKYGEKEFLSIGFVIMALSTGIIPFVTDGNPAVWAIILFMSRVGAAMVEIMADTYFFKKVDASKAHLITFSRMTRPLAYIVSPVIATLLFLVFDMKGLFLFLGFLMLYGLRYSLAIKDTN